MRDQEVPFAVEEHTFWQSIVLHLLPGLLGGLVYYASVGWMKKQGFPSIAALMLGLVFVVTVFELGFLVYQSRKQGKKLFDRDGVIKYRKALPGWQYVVWSVVIILFSGLLTVLMTPVSDFLAELFAWMPPEMMLDMGLSGEYSKTAMVITYALLLIFGVLVGPAVEELYFRGYLLPRMPAKLKGWAPVLHSALFALYHTWTPWLFAARLLGVLPLILVVKRKRNIYLGVIAHCLLNSIDFFVGVAFILKMSG